MRRFKLKARCGNHIERDEKGELITYKSGDTVSSDRDLVTMFPDKFELVSGQGSEDIPTAPEIPSPSKGKKGKKKGKKKDAVSETQSPEPGEKLSEHGIDVTANFPIVSELSIELKVFEKSKWFTVVDPENDEVLNEKKLRRDKVEGFLKDYLHDDDEDEDKDEDEDEDEDLDDDDEDEDDEKEK